jgi:hypothetical protein
MCVDIINDEFCLKDRLTVTVSDTIFSRALYSISTFQLVTMLLTIIMGTTLVLGGKMCIFAIFRHHDQV